MNLFLLFNILLFGAAAIFSLINHAHMLQQNSYYPSRYLRWLKSNFKDGLILNLTALAAAVLLAAFKLYIWALILGVITALVKFFTNKAKQKRAVKPLVFTARIKRYFAAGIVFVAALATIGFIFDAAVCLYIAVVLCYCTPVLTLILWAITAPIERIVAAYYINDAKKILKRSAALKVIGVTGSFGKTSVKQILGDLLCEKYNVLTTPQSFNTPMGVVRTVRQYLKRDTQVFVCEMGAKNKGDIKELCKIANPDFAVITSVGEQHLETFKSLDNVATTKFELADYTQSKDGFVLVNFDSAPARAKAKGMKVISYGTTEDCDFYAKCIKIDRFGSTFTVVYKNEEINLRTRLLGKHNVLNVTAGVGAALLLGVSQKDIAFGVAQLKPTAHRLETKPFIAGSLMIDDAYNANPEGCLEAVNVLSCFEGAKKVIITPGLVELGDKEAECNAALASAAAKVCDYIILVGKKRAALMQPAIEKSGFDKQKLFVAESFAEAVQIYKGFADNNTVVLVENDLPDNYLN